jgi:hypothetical protein
MIADQSVRIPFNYEAPKHGELKGHSEQESLVKACLLTFAACWAAALIICGLTPDPPIAEIWQRIRPDRAADQEDSVKPDHSH